MYKDLATCVHRLSDGAIIPKSVDNADYASFLDWLAAGNTPESSLPEQRETLWSAIKAERDRRKNDGVLVGGNWFHSDADSRIQQLALVMMGAAVPAVQWKTLGGSFVTMSQALAGGIFQASAANDQALFARAEQLRAQVNASSDPASIDILAGWPASFGDIE